MIMLRAALFASALTIAAPALAQSPFDGTWKGDPASAKLDVKPERYSLTGGNYDCGSCMPPFTVKADGAFHAVKDRPYWDEISVRVVDDRTLLTQLRKGGKLIAENRRVVSAGGDTMTVTSTNTNNAAGAKVDQNSTLQRVGAKIPGAHLASGSWSPQAGATTMSENAITMTLKVEGDRLRLSSPMGETLDAKLGGDYAPNVGDPGKTLTKAALLAPNKLQLTDMRGGKVVQVATYTIAQDGRTMTGDWIDPRDGSKGVVTITKQ